MRINYELDELDKSVRSQIELELRRARIPYLLEEDQLLVHKMDERAVDEIISQLGTVHNPGASPAQAVQRRDNSAIVSGKPIPRPSQEFKPPTSASNTIKEVEIPNLRPTNGSRNNNEGAVALTGGAIGVVLGLLLVIAQFQDPNQDGRVYLFLPAIILGGIGFFWDLHSNRQFERFWVNESPVRASRPSGAVRGTGRHTCGSRCVPRSRACQRSLTQYRATTLVISKSTSWESTNALVHHEWVPMVRLRIPTPPVIHQALHR